MNSSGSTTAQDPDDGLSTTATVFGAGAPAVFLMFFFGIWHLGDAKCLLKLRNDLVNLSLDFHHRVIWTTPTDTRRNLEIEQLLADLTQDEVS